MYKYVSKGELGVFQLVQDLEKIGISLLNIYLDRCPRRSLLVPKGELGVFQLVQDLEKIGVSLLNGYLDCCLRRSLLLPYGAYEFLYALAISWMINISINHDSK